MSNLAEIFTGDAKVVISPDEMRAWVMLPPAPKGVKYTVEAVEEWLPQNGVVYGARKEMIREAIDGSKSYELMEVARGDAPVDATPMDYELRIEKKPFTGLRGNTDGSLIYEDISFLTEVEEDAVLADIVRATRGTPGKTVTGKPVEPRPAEGGRELKGSGFVLSENGKSYIAPKRSHVSIVNNELIVVPMRREEKWSPEMGVLEFDGNVLIEGDVLSGSEIKVTGSVYIEGRVHSAHIKAGRNVLLCQGMRGSEGYGSVEAGEYVWSMVLEAATVTAGKDLNTNHMMGCEAEVQGRAVVIGGRGQISNTTLYAREGVVCGMLGDEQRGSTVVSVGMSKELIERYEGVDRRVTKTTQDVQGMVQSISAYEKINRNKPDKGKGTAEYRDMVKKRDQMLSVLKLLDTERTRTKRTMDAYSAVTVIARDRVFPGVEVHIDTRVYEVLMPMQRVKFKRDGEIVEAIAAQGR